MADARTKFDEARAIAEELRSIERRLAAAEFYEEAQRAKALREGVDGLTLAQLGGVVGFGTGGGS
jgi:ubiquinone biosynthesis protein UbiJ